MKSSIFVRSLPLTFLILKRFATAYGLLITMAAGGLAFANIFGFAATAMFFGGENAQDLSSVRTTMNVGWIFGVCIALFGAFMQFRKKRSLPISSGTTDTSAEQNEHTSIKGRRHGFFASAAWGGFFGGLLGTVFGASFVLLWFSFVFSPFASAAWSNSVTVKKQRTGTRGREVPVAVTDDQVALYAFAIPVAIGVISGSVFGGIVRSSDK